MQWRRRRSRRIRRSRNPEQSARAHLVRPETSRSFLCPFPRKGRAERMDGSPRPRRHLLSNAARGSVHPRTGCTAVCALTGHTIQRAEKPRDRPKTQETACVPHADGLFGLLHVPRNCRFCRHAAWFVRTAARTRTWTVRPILLRSSSFAGHAQLRALSAWQGMRAGVHRPLSHGSRTFHP